MSITVVFDTNILFSAAGWRGIPFQCVERARIGEIQAVTCVELINELGEKLESRLHFSPDQAAETLADYLSFLQIVQIPRVLDAVPRDPEDNMVLETAIEGHAQYIISGDNDLLVLREFRGIQIVRASRLPENSFQPSGLIDFPWQLLHRCPDPVDIVVFFQRLKKISDVYSVRL